MTTTWNAKFQAADRIRNRHNLFMTKTVCSSHQNTYEICSLLIHCRNPFNLKYILHDNIRYLAITQGFRHNLFITKYSNKSVINTHMNMLNINQLLRHIITLPFNEHCETNNSRRCDPLPQHHGTGSHIWNQHKNTNC